MEMINLSLDRYSYADKESAKRNIRQINNRIAEAACQMQPAEAANCIGQMGKTFSPAVFQNGKRRKENFYFTELFVLDFDDGISYQDFRERIERYHFPLYFTYYTFSSTKEHEKFRAVFRHDCLVYDHRAALIILQLLAALFPECDKSCIDISRIFLGSNNGLIETPFEIFNITQLAMTVQLFLHRQGDNNYQRKLKALSKKTDIAVKGKSLRIVDALQEGSKSEEKPSSAINIYTAEVKNSSLFRGELKYVIYLLPPYQQGARQENGQRNNQAQVRAAFDISSICKLYKEFKEGTDISHDGRFLLMTNLRFIKNNDFMRMIKANGHDYVSWKNQLSYCRDNNYKPTKCDKCRYYEECGNHGTLLSAIQDSKIRHTDDYIPPVYCSLKEAETQLRANLIKAIEDYRKGIYLIKAQTALGKTYQYCNIVGEYPNRRFLIAAPTNRLKQEIAKRLSQNGIDCAVTPSIDEPDFPQKLREEIKRDYSLGLQPHTLKILNDFIKDEGNDPMDRKACEEYIEKMEKIDEARVIVTTHARFLHFKEEKLKDFTVIIDEDILMLYIFNGIITVDLGYVEALASNTGLPEVWKNILQKVIHAPDETYVKKESQKFGPVFSKEFLLSLGIGGEKANVNGLLGASAFVKYEKENKVVYYTPQTLPKGKYIILSATFNKKIYEKYFMDHTIYSLEGKPVKYKGKLIQYTRYSLGRCGLDGKMEMIRQFAENLAGQGTPVITFKKFSQNTNKYGLHYGNEAGVDKLCGQNIILIGTPFSVEDTYKLIACHMGEDVNREKNPHRERIEYNGYSFLHTTYSNPLLREIQIYCISSELEQAIGRARLLRKDCTVYLFSGFPCEQAELRQEDYLEGLSVEQVDEI